MSDRVVCYKQDKNGIMKNILNRNTEEYIYNVVILNDEEMGLMPVGQGAHS